MLMCIAVCVYTYTFYVLVSKRPLFKRSWERDTPIKENMGADALQPTKCRRQGRKKGAECYHYGGRCLPAGGQILTTMGADAYHLTQKKPYFMRLCGAGKFQYY